MGWSKGIDLWVDDNRALSAKTVCDDQLNGQILINAVGARNTHAHIGFEVTEKGVSVWGALTDSGQFSGPQQSAATTGLFQPIARLSVDPATAHCELALRISSARTAGYSAGMTEGMRERYDLHPRGPAEYDLGITSSRSHADELTSNGGLAIPLAADTQPVWLGVARVT